MCPPLLQIGNRVLYVFFTHVKELFGDVVLKPVVRPLRWSNMATMPALPETQESIKEEIRRQVSAKSRETTCVSSLLFKFLKKKYDDTGTCVDVVGVPAELPAQGPAGRH